MSDREMGGSSDDDLSLPKATVAKMISELLPPEMVCAKETRDLIIECCVGEPYLQTLLVWTIQAHEYSEFIHLISSEANEICESDSKKTIAPEHIIKALDTLGFQSFLSEVEDVLKEHKQQQKDKEKKVSKFEESGLTEEELAEKQAALFAESRARQAGQSGQMPT